MQRNRVPVSAGRHVPARVADALARAAALVLLALVASGAGAHERAYYFQHVNAEDDLAQNTVGALLQDRTGFLWIATQGGLHRYDGYRFVLYQNDPADPRSLPSNFVTALAEDDQGQLWVGSNGKGVARFDAGSGRFVALATGEDLKSARNAVSALRFDADSGLWVGSRFGIELVDAQGNRRDVLVLDPRSGSQVNGFAESEEGTIWTAASDGLYRTVEGTLATSRVAPDLPLPALSIHADRGHRLWVGTGSGLYSVGSSGGARRVWPGGEDGAEPPLPVQSIESDERGRLWLSVSPFGLVVFDPATGRSERLRSDPRLKGALPEDTVRVLMRDRSGLMWLGGIVQGLCNVEPDGARFRYLMDDNPARPFVDTNNVRALYEDESGALWIGTEGDGLKRYDPITRRFEYFDGVLDALPGAVPRNVELRVFAIRGAGAGELWLATNRGVYLLDPARRTARALPVDPSQPERALAEASVRSLLVARDGTLWLGGSSTGLAHYDPATGRYSHLRADPGSESGLWHNAVHALHQDRAGRLWIGTFDGLNLIEPGSETVRRIERNAEDPGSLAGSIVRSIYEAGDGTLWFGTHSGLSRLESIDADKARFRRYLTTDGLPSATIYAILGDARGRLWLSGNRGLILFDPAQPSAPFRAFSLEDGLQGLEFNGGSALRLADGRLAFGGAHGINLYSPERISRSDYAPPLAFTAYQTGSVRHRIDDPGAFKALTVAQRERIYGFEFASLDLAAPARNRFEYRLDGFDARWLDLGGRHEVSFSNLDAGDYVLRVRGSNRDQVQSGKELALALTVTPSWWGTRAMRVVYVLLAVLALAMAVLMHRARLSREQRHNAELREREERLQVALWGSGDEFWDWNIAHGVLYRIGADQLLGFPSQHVIAGDDWRKRAVHPDDLARVEQILAEHVSGERDLFESEHRVLNAEGDWVWVRSRGKIVERAPDGSPLRVAGTAHNITETLADERERRIAREVIRSMSEAVTVCDLHFRFVSVNPAFSRITGYQEHEIRASSTDILNCGRHEQAFYDMVRRTAEASGHWSGEIWQRRKNGEEFLCWLELSEVRDSHGDRSHWVAVLTDITSRKRAEQELRYLANFDPLTSLPNRTLLGERLGHALLRARRHGTRVAVLYLDLDRFKHVNDSLGHGAGDRLLAAAAERIGATVRGSDTVARLGGDEFTVVLEDLHDSAEADRVAEKLIEAFRLPFRLTGEAEVVISTSIGVALYPDHGQVASDLLKYADSAMYGAKESGRNTVKRYTEAMDAQARLRASTIAHLHKALERHEFSLVYQPKMSLADGRITGVEALLRWKSPDLGDVPPSTFIPLAEDTGLILPIGEWVLRESCAQLARWGAAGLAGPSIAVNVSMAQLTRGELVSRLAAILDEHRIPPHRLELELTETMVMANPTESIRTLGAIKALGIRLAIDDFGTGYSSLAYLKRLPIDILKVDKEFVGDITTDSDDEAIATTVIMMAHTLDLSVVAEGVETNGQLEFLRERHCDEVQGNLISVPLDAARCLRFLVDHRDRFEAARRD